MENKRFEITETDGSVRGFYVVVDKETGVNYVVAKFGTGVGICPLIDKDGKPIVKGTDDLIEKAREEIPISDSDTADMQYGGITSSLYNDQFES